MKKLLTSACVIALSASMALAEVVLGTGAVTQATAGNQLSSLGGAGSLGNGIAISGSAVRVGQVSVGAAVGATNGAASASQSNAGTVGSSDTTNFGASLGGAGAFSGSSTAGGGTAGAFAFGGLGVFQP